LLRASGFRTIRDDMSANAGSRLSRFGTSCLRRVPAVLAFCFAIAAAPFPAHGAETTNTGNEPNLTAATQTDIAALKKRIALAEKFYGQQQLPQIEAEWRTIVKLSERLLGPANPETVRCRYSLVAILGIQGKYAEGEAEERTIIKIHQHTFGPDHPLTLGACTALASHLIIRGEDLVKKASAQIPCGSLALPCL
jgi:hypothetical protein